MASKIRHIRKRVAANNQPTMQFATHDDARRIAQFTCQQFTGELLQLLTECGLINHEMVEEAIKRRQARETQGHFDVNGQPVIPQGEDTPPPDEPLPC